MTVLITLTTAGIDTGPFDLYSNLDGYTTPFVTGVSKSSLVAGYTSNVVPDNTTTVRVKSTGNCTSYVDIPCGVVSFLVSLSTGATCPEACNDYNGTSTNIFNLT
jgi:hypothetical protein